MNIILNKFKNKIVTMYLGELGRKTIIDNIGFNKNNRIFMFDYHVYPGYKTKLILSISINNKEKIRKELIEGKNSIDVLPVEVVDILKLKDNILRIEIQDNSYSINPKPIWNCTGKIEHQNTNEIKKVVENTIQNQNHLSKIVDHAISQYISDQLILDSSKHKEIYERKKNEILVNFNNKIYDDISNEDNITEELTKKASLVDKIKQRVISSILKDLAALSDLSFLVNQYINNLDQLNKNGKEDINNYKDILENKLLELSFQNIQERIHFDSDPEKQKDSDVQSIFQKTIEAHLNTFQEKVIETALKDIEKNKKINDSQSPLYQDIAKRIEDSILSVDNIKEFIENNSEPFKEYKDKIFSSALNILYKENYNDLKEKFAETVFKTIIDEIDICDYPHFFEQNKTQTDNIKTGIVDETVSRISLEWIRDYLLRQPISYLKNITPLFIESVERNLQESNFFNDITKEETFPTIGKQIVELASKNIDISDHADIIKNKKTEIIQSIIKPEEVVDNFIQQSIQYISAQNINLDSQIKPIFEHMNQFIKELESQKNENFRSFIREMIVLCLLYDQTEFDQHKDYFNNGLIEIFYIFLENKINISNPQVMLESFIENKVLFFLEDTIGKSDVRGKQKIKSSLLKTFGLKPINIDVGRTIFNRQYHRELSKENNRGYPRNVIIEVKEQGFEADWSRKIIRKAGVSVNYR